VRDAAHSNNLGISESALLLIDSNASRQDCCVAKVIQFFGVPAQKVPAAEFCLPTVATNSICAKPRLLCSADAFLRILEAREQRREYGPWQLQAIHSAFIYPGDNADSLARLVRRLYADNVSIIRSADPGAGDFVVSDQLNQFSGVMAGIRVVRNKVNTNGDFILTTAKRNGVKIISLGDGAVFSKLEYNGVPVFFSTSREIIDLDAELKSQNFNVRDHFLSAVPLVLYIKWAFGETCWSAPETTACLVIDDPVLKSRHGFVDFQELLSLMKRHGFSTNVAFIPWNWRRSSPEVVRLFRENPESYSISVHGCDHTRAEFGSADRQRLYWKAQQALKRMNRHEAITGIRHDRVMVFPQGIFSEAATSALKHTDLIAAVNNDVICAGHHPRPVTISDVWDIAVMRYSNFPIFTRRYPWEGVENFAFDALLGKPLIMIIHHDYCSDHCRRLVDFVDRVNALKCSLTWRSLGDVVRRSCRQRELSRNTVEVEMYATELRLENRSKQPKHFLIKRRECEPSAIREICDGSGPIAWNSLNRQINFEIELSSGESTMVGIRFHELAGNGSNGDSLPFRFKTMLRRYLCEVRDNYITTGRLRLAGFFQAASAASTRTSFPSTPNR
jgi:hypothetical protein